jgi:beta propeller repeat protein
MLHGKLSRLLLSAPLLCLLFALTSVHGLDIENSVLYSNVSIPAVPYMHEGSILYQDFSQGTYRFFTLDIAQAVRTEVRDNKMVYLSPAAYNGTHISWITYSSGGGGGGNPIGGMRKTSAASQSANYRVDLFTLSSKQTQAISSDAAYKQHLAMDDKRVLWTDFRHSTATDTFSEIYSYSISGGNATRITDAVSYKANGNVQGSIVVWQDYRNAGTNTKNADIYAYDFSANKEIPICTDGAYQDQPAVYGSYIVWQDYRNAGTGDNADIYLYDLSTKAEKAICTEGSYQAYPQIYGDYVVWHDYRNISSSDAQNVDIYLYDIKNEKEYQVTSKGGYQDVPAICGTTIVWYDHVDGKLYKGIIDPDGGSVASIARPADRSSMGARPGKLTSFDLRGRTIGNGLINAPRGSGLVFVATADGQIMRSVRVER